MISLPRVVNYLFFTAVFVVVLLLLASLFPIPWGPKFFIVESGSMEPAIHTGSIVMITRTDDYKVGDVITFGANDKIRVPTTHRIQEIKQAGEIKTYVTKGDANNAPDMREVKQEEILGKVVLTIPYVGYVVAMAKRPYGFLAILIIPAIIIIYGEIVKIIKEIKKRKNVRL